MQHRIGVISDSHVPDAFPELPNTILEHFTGVELIIHAGDLSVLSVISELKTIAPVVAVHGNTESPEVVAQLPLTREEVVGHCRIGIVHMLGRKDLEPSQRAKLARQAFPDARVVVYGHTHIPYNQEHNGQLLFCPGSAAYPMDQTKCSVGSLYVDDEEQSVRGEIIYFECGQSPH